MSAMQPGLSDPLSFSPKIFAGDDLVIMAISLSEYVLLISFKKENFIES